MKKSRASYFTSVFYGNQATLKALDDTLKRVSSFMMPWIEPSNQTLPVISFYDKQSPSSQHWWYIFLEKKGFNFSQIKENKRIFTVFIAIDSQESGLELAEELIAKIESLEVVYLVVDGDQKAQNPKIKVIPSEKLYDAVVETIDREKGRNTEEWKIINE